MKLGSTYLITKDFKESLVFYENLLEQKVDAQNMTRWATFDLDGGCIALYNPDYDKKQIEEGKNIDKQYSDSYLEFITENQTSYGNNVVLNLWTKDLITEYKRLQERNIGELSEMMYLNTYLPYHFFMIKDPDGNIVEITGEINKGIEEIR